MPRRLVQRRNAHGHPPRRRPRRSPGFTAFLFAFPFAVVSAVFLFDTGRSGGPLRFAAALPADRETAQFAACEGAIRATCVVDGDTFWYHGSKIRIADINTPEVSSPRCASEAQLGAQATRRLTNLLNQGAFTLAPSPDGRDADDYGRKLRLVTRGGASLGDRLVAEGLAERWQGYRRDWC